MNDKLKEFQGTLAAARDEYWAERHNKKGAADAHLDNKADAYIKALENYNHSLQCYLAEHQVTHWHRIKDLPSQEQVPFRKWLSGQTCPLIEGLPYDQQDAYYQWDYDRWKEHLKGTPVLWD